MACIARRASRLVRSMLVSLLLASALLGTSQAMAQEPQPTPVALMTLPLYVVPGKMVTLQIRGKHLQGAKEVLLSGGDLSQTLVVKKHEEAKPPDRVDPNVHGDYRVEVEVSLPENFSGESVELVVDTEKGKTAPLVLRVIPSAKLVAEMEPNDRFRQPQSLEVGRIAAGEIHQARDVDVYRVELKAGQKYIVDVQAASLRSTADMQLSIFDPSGNLLASSDDRSAESRDPQLLFVPATDGPILISLLDATDRGSNMHPYLLSIQPQ